MTKLRKDVTARRNPGVVYVLALANGYVKVGRTQDPETRRNTHTKDALRFGNSVEGWWESPGVADNVWVEREILRALASRATSTIGSETFTGIPFADAVVVAERAAEECPTVDSAAIGLTDDDKFRLMYDFADARGKYEMRRSVAEHTLREMVLSASDFAPTHADDHVMPRVDMAAFVAMRDRGMITDPSALALVEIAESRQAVPADSEAIRAYLTTAQRVQHEGLVDIIVGSIKVAYPAAGYSVEKFWATVADIMRRY